MTNFSTEPWSPDEPPAPPITPYDAVMGRGNDWSRR